MSQAPIALITGASRGIGAAVASQLAAAGYDVCINYLRDKASARQVLADIQGQGGNGWLVQADVSQKAGIESLFAAVDARGGALKIFINNAGILYPQSSLADMEFERIESVFRLNVIGALYCAREAVRRMSTRRGGSGGSIVNVSSAASRLGSPDEYIDYAASKGAMDTLTLGLAREEGPYGIRTNAVRPGLIETEIHASGGMPDRVQRLQDGVPMRRGGSAAEVAEAIVWLALEQASYVNGALLDVSGGR